MHRKYCDITAETCAPTNSSLPACCRQCAGELTVIGFTLQIHRKEVVFAWNNVGKGEEKEVSGLQQAINTWSIAWIESLCTTCLSAYYSSLFLSTLPRIHPFFRLHCSQRVTEWGSKIVPRNSCTMCSSLVLSKQNRTVSVHSS